MRYRRLDANGDYVFGFAGTPNPEFYTNVPEAVAQAVQTRLGLLSGEWFLDLNEGTPYNTQILGKGTQDLYDAAIQARILGTEGVSQLVSYGSTLQNRALAVDCTILTIYSTQPIQLPTIFVGSNVNLDPFGNPIGLAA